jgi:uncharacterized membrane protein
VKRSAEPPRPPGYAWMHVLNAALFVGYWTFTIMAYGSLPDQIPGHIGLHGVTRWEPKDGGMWFLLPIMSSVHVVLAYGLSALAGATPGAGMSVPFRNRILALPRDGQRYAMEPFRPFMYGMATWLLLLTMIIHHGMYRVALEAQHGEPRVGGMIWIIVASLGALVLGVIWQRRAIARNIDEWEAWQAGLDRAGDGG